VAVERRPIQKLPLSLVNRIAAGEVVERPASVVKELVENAIDAGATSILIEIEDGGRQAIRVVDDGCGIPPGDLHLAFAEHATSKLTCDDDLFRIGTMGFRGEALASIGAVSHARIVSRTAESDAAYEILDRGGMVSERQAAAGNVGTAVEVRDLFFNTPARRKFFRGSATEAGHISEIVLRLSLPYPSIHFKLASESRTMLDLAATTAEERLLAAWPADFAEQRLPLELRDTEIHVAGLVGLPELANPTAKYQYLYLNGRHIRDRFMQHALREAYRGLIEPGRQPAAVILLTMPPQDVDVNVHPTKIEVRFRDSGRIHGLLLSGIRQKLLGSDLTPSAVAAPAVDEAKQQNLRARLAEFFKQMPPAQSALPLGEGGRVSAAAGGQRDAVLDSWPLPASLATDPPPTALDHPPTAQVGPVVWQDQLQDAGVGGLPLATRQASSSVGVAMQLHNTYLVVQSDDGLMIIDQHALHERVIYEDLLRRIGCGPLESQQMLMPDVVPASAKQMALLEQIQPLLKRLGVEVREFGPGSIAVQAFPSFLDKLEPGRFVHELLERGEQEQMDLHEEGLLHEVLEMMACKAAVKAGDPLSQGEIDSLLASRHLVERSSNCPHGRPTMLRLSLRDLEKQFKRAGF